MSGHATELLGAYALGVLDGDEQAAVRAHLDACAPCRREAGDLREMEAVLGEIPPEVFIDGPPPDGGVLLLSALREVRGERGRRNRRRRARWAVVAVLAGVLAAGCGAVLGRATAPAVLASASAAVPGTRTAAGVDAETGATMTVAVQPAAGWVRVHAAVGGVPAGEQCRLYVVARDGTRQQAAGWLVDDAGAAAGTTLDGSALIAPADVAAVQAETLAGEILVVVPV